MDKSEIDHFLSVNLIGESSAFRAVFQKVKKISRYDVPIFISGETGTGKELIAHAIHSLSRRNGCAFIPVNCGAIPELLIEDEFFGHVKGAYTDAQSKREGIFSQANSGTLFLDEIDALPYKGQVSLLRLIQEKEFKPIGSHKTCYSDVRLIAATNSNILIEIEKEKFRQDLFFRLNVMNVELPALRERGKDVELLAQFFIERHCAEYKLPKKTLHPSAIEHLYCYNWPGNVRELENVLLREILLSDSEMLYLKSLEAKISPYYNEAQSLKPLLDMEFRAAKIKIVTDFERNYLKNLMERTAGNVTKAAMLAGTDRRMFGKLLKKHDINRTLYSN